MDNSKIGQKREKDRLKSGKNLESVSFIFFPNEKSDYLNL